MFKFDTEVITEHLKYIPLKSMEVILDAECNAIAGHGAELTGNHFLCIHFFIFWLHQLLSTIVTHLICNGNEREL